MNKIEKNGCEYAVPDNMLQHFLDNGWHVVEEVKPKATRKPAKAKETKE